MTDDQPGNEAAPTTRREARRLEELRQAALQDAVERGRNAGDLPDGIAANSAAAENNPAGSGATANSATTNGATGNGTNDYSEEQTPTAQVPAVLPPFAAPGAAPAAAATDASAATSDSHPDSVGEPYTPVRRSTFSAPGAAAVSGAAAAASPAAPAAADVPADAADELSPFDQLFADASSADEPAAPVQGTGAASGGAGSGGDGGYSGGLPFGGDAQSGGGDEPPAKPVVQKRSLLSRAIGVSGELLITGGVLVLLFLGWQLWWNSIVLSNDQTNNASHLSQDWESAAPTDTTTPTPTPTPGQAIVSYGDPVVSAVPSEHSDFAVLYVPRFGEGYKRTISEGVDPKTVLNKGGAGRYSTSQMPGEVGNFAIAAHRDGWGSAFININELQLNDAIYVETQDGWYTYRFRTMEFVTPFGVGVIDPVPQVPDAVAGDRLITLTSCNPLYIASERIIAYGVLESWQPRSAGPPAEIASTVGTGN